MDTGDEPEHVHLTWWSAFVLGYGFALGFLFAQMTLAIVAGVIFAIIWSATH